ncbi:hypothetical protein JOL62DRAFT_282481 [Phyllosticta paracitricarpa]|uniref:Uncharacterized protein n=1 Tax=Phyllosticta paracitricarpa TaxID=2016321 RepID=A0ABR1MXJ0_9PEZI
MKLRKLPSVDYTPTRAYITRDDLPDAARTTSSRPVRRSYALVSKRGRPAGTTRRSTRSGSSNAPEANVPAPVSGDSAGVRKRGRPRKDDQSAESTTAEPAIPEAASSPELLGRGRGRPGLRALGGHPATDSVEKKVKFAAGVKKAAPKTKAALKAKGNGNKPMSTQQLMFAFFRENRDSVKHLKFARQQKALGTLVSSSAASYVLHSSTSAENHALQPTPPFSSCQFTVHGFSSLENNQSFAVEGVPSQPKESRIHRR